MLHWTLLILHILVAPAAAGHALLYKRDSKAALGWISVSLLFPLVGPLMYFLLGINRVRSRAVKLEHRQESTRRQKPETASERMGLPHEIYEVAPISDAVTRHPTLGGNHIELLHNGEAAYPAMIAAIDTARTSVYLATYIFDTDTTGLQFIDALDRAVGRGVAVRVLIDGFGELYAFPRARWLLKKRKVPTARFLPPRLIPPAIHLNLRNHRKMLVTDGKIGFIGGMNIGNRHLAENMANPWRVVDLHFRVTGPVVSQIESIFIEDWAFASGELLAPSFPMPPGPGAAVCRSIADGPSEDLDKLATILVGAVSLARRQIHIMTPYFLPSRELIMALQTAALRGVSVSVILPAKNNLPYVKWASNNMLWELLRRGVRVWFQPPPFVHTKIFVVDNRYALIGSANIDPRSLRLNFELTMEVYDPEIARRLTEHAEACRLQSREVSLAEMDARPLLTRVRDAFSWLFSPYL
jgi:cardiolipin synthase